MGKLFQMHEICNLKLSNVSKAVVFETIDLKYKFHYRNSGKRIVTPKLRFSSDPLHVEPVRLLTRGSCVPWHAHNQS